MINSTGQVWEINRQPQLATMKNSQISGENEIYLILKNTSIWKADLQNRLWCVNDNNGQVNCNGTGLYRICIMIIRGGSWDKLPTFIIFAIVNKE